MKKFKDFLKEQPTNWTRSNASYAGFSADAPDPTAGYDPKLFKDPDDLLDQGYQTPGESGLAKWRFSNVYPVMKLKLDKSSDGPSIDDMVDASKEFVNIEAERTEQRIRKTFHQFMGYR